jgi:hypothetical protein
MLRLHIRYLDEFFHINSSKHYLLECNYKEIHNKSKNNIIKILVVVFRDMQKFLNTKQKDQPEQLYIIW